MVPSYLVSSISSVHADAGVANTQQRQAKSIHSQRCNTLISMSLTLVVGHVLVLYFTLPYTESGNRGIKVIVFLLLSTIKAERNHFTFTILYNELNRTWSTAVRYT